jgi:hypothetical protein
LSKEYFRKLASPPGSFRWKLQHLFSLPVDNWRISVDKLYFLWRFLEFMKNILHPLPPYIGPAYWSVPNWKESLWDGTELPYLSLFAHNLAGDICRLLLPYLSGVLKRAPPYLGLFFPHQLSIHISTGPTKTTNLN